MVRRAKLMVCEPRSMKLFGNAEFELRKNKGVKNKA